MTETEFREMYENRVREATPETLPALISELMSHDHDYGTVCHAIAMAAAATAWAMNRHPGAQGGITGFQSGAIAWEFLRHWGSLYPRSELGGRMIDYEDLLWPQCSSKFTSISKEIWENLQQIAAKRLTVKEDYLAPQVEAHWQSIVAGNVPFGLRVEG